MTRWYDFKFAKQAWKDHLMRGDAGAKIFFLGERVGGLQKCSWSLVLCNIEELKKKKTKQNKKKQKKTKQNKTKQHIIKSVTLGAVQCSTAPGVTLFIICFSYTLLNISIDIPYWIY